jgi:hypothetical protein
MTGKKASLGRLFLGFAGGNALAGVTTCPLYPPTPGTRKPKPLGRPGEHASKSQPRAQMQGPGVRCRVSYSYQNNSIWSSRDAFADAVTRAKLGTNDIRGKTGRQISPTAGVTGDKAQARNDLEERMMEVGNQVAAFAAKSNDNDLAAKVEMTRSSLDRMSDSDLVQTAKRVADAANANLPALAPYGVTKVEVTALETAATTFEEMKGATRDAVVGRKVETMSLPEAIGTVRSIFRNEIDKMMTAFKRTNPDFYNGYFAARVIVNRSPTRTAAKKPDAPKPPPPA